MDCNPNFERGALVFAKTVDGEVERIVWEDCGESVMICSERQFNALLKGWEAPMPIGFPKSAIRLVGTNR